MSLDGAALPLTAPAPVRTVRHRADVLVVGAGVIGLTTAICLAEAGLDVRVVGAEPPPSTTSALATAMVGPSFGLSGPLATRWEQVTVAELAGADDIPGVHHCAGRFAARTPGLVPPGAELAAGYRPCRPDELPDGFPTGFWATVPLIDMPRYLGHLTERLVRAGGELEIRRIDSLAAAATEAPWVVNCSGLGASTLAPDDTVVPVRGPKVVVRNPGLDTFFIEGPPTGTWASYHPHGDHVVLGGSTIGSDPAPSQVELVAIVARCAEIEPRLGGAEVLEHAVGFRPGRPEIRFDEVDLGAARCIHSYGHGGIGVTVSWGAARDVAERIIGSR